jgi:DNA-binding MarR family transcriptional regulator
MARRPKGETLRFRAFVLLQRTRDLLFRCQDQTVGKHGLTAEQYSVIAAIKQLDDPVRPTDIGRLVDHKVNTVSMIADRMVQAGLLDRIRDLPDRRAVRLVVTDRGERAYQLATPEVMKLVDRLFSPLAEEDRRTLIRVLENLRDTAHKSLNPQSARRR